MMAQVMEETRNKALDIAKYIICVALNNGDSITNLKLQKLLYYAQAWYLVNNGNKKLFEDRILAWQYGPVVQAVYDTYKEFGRSQIVIDENECDLDKNFCNIPEYVKTYLNEFCNEFFRYSATELVTMTHQEKPWIEAIAKGIGTEISTETMYEFYTDMLKDESCKI